MWMKVMYFRSVLHEAKNGAPPTQLVQYVPQMLATEEKTSLSNHSRPGEIGLQANDLVYYSMLN
jgi:hypothetical protein